MSMPPSGTSRPQRRSDVKKSIAVLGVEADGIRGVRLEENGADWNCIDSEFWPTGAKPGDEGDAPGPDAAGFDGADGPSADDRYAATVDALNEAAKRFGTNEFVLSMPLSSLLIKVFRTSVEERDSLSATAGAELGKVSPFPDETPVAGIETVAETDSDLVTMFAALPESAAVDIGDALDEAQVRVVRTDATALGWLRNLWPRIITPQSAARVVVLMDLCDGWDVVVLDNGAPSLLRGLGAISDPAELVREVTLSLLQAGTGAESCEVAVFSKGGVDPETVGKLEAFGPVRIERVDDADSNWGVDGVARRTLEGASLDVTPADWTELREESRFKKKLAMTLSIAAAGWALVMGVLFGGPFVYDWFTERQKTICGRHSKAYKEVKDMRDKVNLVRKYSDHARSTLEMLKAVSDRMPEGVTLTSYNYKKGEKLSLVGEADQPNPVYDFKNALVDAAFVESEGKDEGKNGGEGEAGGESSGEAGEQEAEKLFSEVTLTGPSKSRSVHKFSIECLFESAEEKK